jgi:glycosyltransferase involved in cell wall biosynthesis
MKLVHTEASLGWGGQEIRSFNEAMALRAKGQVVFFITQPGAKLSQMAKKHGFEVLEVNFFKKYWLFSLPKIFFFLKKHKVDLVVTHSSLDAWLGGIAARCAKIPLVRIRHVSTPTRAGLNARVLFHTLCDFIITTSQEIIQPLARASGKPIENISCIPTGVDGSKLDVDQDSIKDFKKGLGLKQDHIILGTVCVVRSWKGIETFIDAANLLKHDTRLKWLIVGGGYLEQHIKRVKELGLEEVVLFTGHLEDPKIAIACLDVFLLLSTANEGISQATLQASYLKKPLITTPTGGLKEVCFDGKTGFVVPIRSPEKVKEAVLKLTDASLRETLGQNAKEHVKQSFLFEKTLQEVENIYARFSC